MINNYLFGDSVYSFIFLLSPLPDTNINLVESSPRANKSIPSRIYYILKNIQTFFRIDGIFVVNVSNQHHFYSTF